ncbi:MAG: (2Fe-2S) ferredoxin domain-containing protein [Candidatus Manganitrophus sp. SA1]|nr:(2Fe-2S) ferredoxin domain-containing protein [Candidatus Manganitrophus morganii]
MSKYKYHLFICTNRRPVNDPKGCCATKGADDLRSFFKEEIANRGLKGVVRANQAGCLDTCAMGPSVVIYPEGVWYTVKNREDALEVIEKHLLKGEIVERLLMPRSWARG